MARIVIITSAHSLDDHRIFHKQARTLVQAGHEVTLIGLSPEKKDCINSGVHILGLHSRGDRVHRWMALPKLFRQALATPADCYHFHDLEFLPFAWILRIVSGRPVIFDVHEHYDEVILTREYLPEWLRKLLSRLYKLAAPRILRQMFDALVVISRTMQQDFGSKEHVYVVSNYPDKHLFTHCRDTRVSPSKKVFYLGRNLRVNDGVLDVLEAAQQVLRARSDVEFVLVGELSEEPAVLASLDGLDKDPFCQGHIKRMGLVAQEEIVTLLRDGGIGLIPYPVESRKYQVSSPVRMFEYMASCIPVIVTDLGILPKYVKKYKFGIVVPPNSPSHLADAILELLSDPDLAMKLGERGRKAFEQRFNWQYASRELLRAYREILRSS